MLSSLSMGNWGQPIAPLLHALNLSAEKAHFEILNKLMVPDLEWLLFEESFRRVGLSQLPEGVWNPSTLLSYDQLFFKIFDRSISYKYEA